MQGIRTGPIVVCINIDTKYNIANYVIIITRIIETGSSMSDALTTKPPGPGLLAMGCPLYQNLPKYRHLYMMVLIYI